MMLPRFYPILDTQVLARRKCPLPPAVDAVLEGGARILQIRHKGHFSRSIFKEVGEAADSCRKAGALLVIDDRADVAALLDAAVHVGQDDLAPSDARRVIGPDRVLGFSTHNQAQLAAGDREPADYLALGPIFATGSKENPDPVVGVEELCRLRRVTAKPLVAIGGITRENAGCVLEAGADAVAVIGDLLPDACSKRELRRRVEEWLKAVAARPAKQ